MITRLSYKDSCVEWIGDIPSEWNIKPMYTQYCQNRIRNDNSTNTVLSLSYGNLVKRDIEKNQGLLPDNFDSYQLLDVGYIILRMTDLQNDHKSLRVGICEFPGIITSAYIGLSPFKSVHSKYFFYYLYMCDLKKVFYGLGGGLRQSVSYNDFKRFSLPIPPLQEQQKISDYLDYKTLKIDTLIKKTQQKIELLKEQRVSLINTTVTKGLNPNVEMKDSGVEWIGEIPGGWSVISLRYYLTRVGSGTTPRGGGDVYSDSGIPFLRSQNIHFDGLHLNNVVFISEEIHSNMGNTIVRYGDVLLNITGGSIGRSCVVNIHEEMNVNQHVSILRTKNSLINFYLNYCLTSSIGQEQVDYNQTGGNREGLTSENIKNFKFGLPPLQEQQQIVDYLDKETTKLDKLIDTGTKRINLLKEYRQSLISDVVTGKVDVRGEVLV